MKDVFAEHCDIFLNFLKLLQSSKHHMNAVHGQKGDCVESSVRFPWFPLLSRHVCPLPSFISPHVFSHPHSFASNTAGLPACVFSACCLSPNLPLPGLPTSAHGGCPLCCRSPTAPHFSRDTPSPPRSGPQRAAAVQASDPA